MIERLIDPGIPVHCLKEEIAVDALRGTDEQIAMRPECVVERGSDLLLQLAVEIDEEVAARDKVEVGKRRIAQQAVRRKHHEISNFPLYPVVLAFFREIAVQPLFRDVRADGTEIGALPRGGERGGIKVRGEQLQVRTDFAPRGLLEEEYRQRIGLFA